ncbi:IPT/TIG domain-containing protein [Paenibacillus sp. FSL W7-1279]|uniref:IPT/TIG domain-containing protein n=1 Tax=Paenibacillus sp. FSL W7-1279 TaxID=2921697 RepID=UPI0030D88CA2
MKLKPKILISFLAFTLIIVQCFNFSPALFAQVNDESVKVTKELNPIEIFKGGESEVTINVQGTPDSTFIKPNDIILIIDRSGSMGPNYAPNNGEDKMRNAKEAAKGFIDLVDFSKHRVGIVDFASNVNHKDLTSNPADLKQYVNGIQANGGTATKSAIEKAQELLRNHRPDAQPVIILLTDGQATEPSPETYARQVALEQASSAKTEGVVFYTIALLLPTENPDTSAPNLLMREMATTSHHHHFVLGSVGLAEIYAAIVEEIGVASAYDVTVTDFVSSQFEIVPGSYNDNIPQPIVNGNTISWSFLELKNELLTFKYKIRHKSGAPSGSFPAGDQDISVKYKDYLGQQHQYSVSQPILTVKQYAPIVTSIEPNYGHIDGSEVVVINGEHFSPNATVHFGSTSLPNVEYINSHQLKIITPPGTQGMIPVTVTNEDGQSAVSEYRYYADPQIVEVLPNEGPLEGGTKVLIKGDYFMQDATVSIDGKKAVVTKSNINELEVTTPAGTLPGVVDVTVTNSDGTTITLVDAFTYIEGPQINSINPNIGSRTGGETVVLTGERFKDGVKVYFNNTLVLVNYVSSNEIRLTTPAWAKAESVDVTVENPNGQKHVLPKGYTYEDPNPVVNSVSPSTGPLAGGTLVYIKGNHIKSGAKLIWGGIEQSGYTYINAGEIRLKTPSWSNAGLVSIKIVNPDGKEVEFINAFEYLAPPDPTLTSISPTSGLVTGGTTVTVKGADFPIGTKVYFGDIEVPVQSLSATQIVITAPEWSAPGKVNVSILTPMGYTANLLEAFEYLPLPKPPAPTISSVSPASGVVSGGNIISINGTNFVNGLELYFGQEKVAYTFTSSSLLRIKVPAGTVPGFVTVSITNPDGQSAELIDGYQYLPLPGPTLTSVSPKVGPVSGGTALKIYGTNFKSDSKVFFADREIAVSYISGTELRTTTPGWATAESVDIRVLNSDGQSAVLTGGFTYEVPPPPPAPTIASVTPNSGPQAGGTLLTIKGSNFNSETLVKIGGVTVSGTLMSTSEIRFKTPQWETPATVDISVSGPDGEPSILANAFTFMAPPEKPNPIVSTVSPNTAELPGGGITITVSGKNFENGSKVFFNNVEIAATLLSSTQLRIKTPAWNASESVTVKVVNPDGKEGLLPDGFTYTTPPPPPAPVLNSITPNTALASTSSLITINGDFFVSGARVAFNDIEVTATFISKNQLRVATPVWSNPESVTVRVINPDAQIGELVNGIIFIPDLPPSISSLSPSSGLTTGGTLVTIYGANYKNGSKVYFNEEELAATYVSSGQLRVRVPAWPNAGGVDVKVVNPDGQQATIQGGFTYSAPAPKPAPTVTSVSPNTGSKSGGNIITVYGTNIQSGAKVEINGVSVAATFLSSTQLRIRVPASSVVGGVSVTIVNPDGQTGTLADAYTYY